ncbi:unnamed protein product, partial [Symbiodinium sp. CCMP2456]
CMPVGTVTTMFVDTAKSSSRYRTWFSYWHPGGDAGGDVGISEEAGIFERLDKWIPGFGGHGIDSNRGSCRKRFLKLQIIGVASLQLGAIGFCGGRVLSAEPATSSEDASLKGRPSCPAGHDMVEYFSALKPRLMCLIGNQRHTFVHSHRHAV